MLGHCFSRARLVYIQCVYERERGRDMSRVFTALRRSRSEHHKARIEPGLSLAVNLFLCYCFRRDAHAQWETPLARAARAVFSFYLSLSRAGINKPLSRGSVCPGESIIRLVSLPPPLWSFLFCPGNFFFCCPCLCTGNAQRFFVVYKFLSSRDF